MLTETPNNPWPSHTIKHTKAVSFQNTKLSLPANGETSCMIVTKSRFHFSHPTSTVPLSSIFASYQTNCPLLILLAVVSEGDPQTDSPRHSFGLNQQHLSPDRLDQARQYVVEADPHAAASP